MKQKIEIVRNINYIKIDIFACHFEMDPISRPIFTFIYCLLKWNVEYNTHSDRMCISSFLMADIFVGKSPKICRHHSVVFITTLQIEHRYCTLATHKPCLTKLLEKLCYPPLCSIRSINYFSLLWLHYIYILL